MPLTTPKAMLKRVPWIRALAVRAGLASRQVDERAFLLDMLPKNSVGAEIGVHKGDFSELILDVVRPARLHLIDPWKYEPSEQYKCAWYGGAASGGQAELDERYRKVLDRFRGPVQAGRVVVQRAFSSGVCGDFPDGHFDWVYIDGNHLYEFVKADLELYFEKLKPGGFLAGDDYQASGWWEDGVKKAVDEFAANRPVETVAIRNGQFVFRKLA